jgi:hypothetical protein
MSGDLTVSSQPGQGATFTVRLPVDRFSEAAAGASSTLRPAGAAAEVDCSR